MPAPTEYCGLALGQEVPPEWADEYQDMYAPGEVGFCRPENATWKLEILPLSVLRHLLTDDVGWREWLDDVLSDEEGLDRWGRLLHEDIREPITVLMVDGQGYLWDGWHRTAASIVSGRDSIPAVVGYPKPDLAPTPRRMPRPGPNPRPRGPG